MNLFVNLPSIFKFYITSMFKNVLYTNGVKEFDKANSNFDIKPLLSKEPFKLEN